MAEADGTIRIATSIDIKNLQSQLEQMKSDIRKTSNDSKKDIAQIGAQFAAVAAAAAGIVKAVQSVGQTIDAYAQKTDRIDKMSQSLGLTRDTFQELDYAFKQNGASLDNFGMGMKSLQEITTKAASGSKTAFDKLGISVKNANGTLKSQDQILTETLSAFNNMQQGVEKSTLATDVFGRSAQELMPLLNQTSGSVDELRQRAHDLGIVLGNDDVDAGVTFGDAMDDLKTSFGALAQGAFVPFISLLTSITNGLTKAVAWLNSGSAAAEVIKAAVIGITAAIGALIAIFVVLPAVITAVSTAFSVLTAAMASNPIGAIAVVITAVLIPAIIYLYKNWDKVCVYIEKWCAELGQDFKIVGAKIKEGFVVGFNAAKIAALSLAQIIADKVLGSVAKLLDVMGKMPFVGDMFKKAADAVRGFKDGLDNAVTSAKQESAEAIADSKAQTANAIADSKARIAQIEEESKARLAALKKVEEEAPADTSTGTGTGTGTGSGTGTGNSTGSVTSGTIELTRTYIDVLKDLTEEEEINSSKAKDGYITEHDELEKNISAIGDAIDEMYTMGITADASGNEQQRALSELIAKYKTFSKQLEVTTGEAFKINIGQLFIGNLKKNIASMKKKIASAMAPVIVGLKSSKIYKKCAEVGSVVSEKIGDGISKAKNFVVKALFGVTRDAATDSAIKTALKNAGKKLASSLASGFTAVKDLLSKAWSAINWMANFDLASAQDAVTSFCAGIGDFFLNAMQNLPAFFGASVSAVGNMVSGLISSLPTIQANIGIIIDNIVAFLVDNFPTILNQVIQFVVAVVTTVLEHAGEIVSAVISVIPVIILALAEALPKIIKAVADAIPQIIKAVADAIPQIVSAVVKAIPAIIGALADALPALITGILDNLPAILLAIINAIPQIVEAVVKVIPAIVLGLVNSVGALIKGIWDAFVSVGSSICNAVVDGIKSAFTWDNIKGVFTTMYDNIVATFKNVGTAVGSVLKAPINALISACNWVIDQINKIRVDVDWLNIHVGFDIPRFSYLAKGTDNWKGGEAIVGEKGPELVDLPAGSVVHPATETASLLSGMSALTSGFMPSLAFTSSGSGNSSMSVNVSPTTVQIDGRTVGRIVYEQIDRLAANS